MGMPPRLTIVDDCKELRHLIRLLAEDELGVACLGVESLSDLIQNRDEVLESHAIIVDINLGKGNPDGIEVYRWIQEQQFSGHVLFLTGHAKESPQVQEASRTGVPILEKPMTASQLLDSIREFFFADSCQAGVS